MGDIIETLREFKRVGTHNGKFHADEVMATAILKEIFDIELVRTRESEILEDLDIVYDVGGGKFDHHDADKELREDGTPYAACGLIWREFGYDVVRLKDQSLNEEEIELTFNFIDRVLMKGIDALDNGMKIGQRDIPLMDISGIISGFNPQWFAERDDDEAFNEAVELAAVVLDNALNSRLGVVKSKEIVYEAFENRSIPEVLVLKTYCPYGENLRNIDKDNEVLYVAYPSKGNYEVQTVRDRGVDRRPFPKSWAGKRDKDLAEITGVDDAVFCHSGRFICIAESLDGIMKLACLAIGVSPKKKFNIISWIKKFCIRKK